MKKIFCLIAVLSPLQIFYAQPKAGIVWGLSADFCCMSEEKESSSAYEILPAPELSLFADYYFNIHAGIGVYAGYVLLADNWNGPEAGFNFKYRIIKKFLVSAGLSYNSISGGTDFPGNLTPSLYKRDFTFLNIGGEYLLSDKVFIELVYSKPLNRDAIFGHSHPDYPDTAVDLFKLVGRLKLGIGFNI